MGVSCTAGLVRMPLYMYRNLHCIKTAHYHTIYQHQAGGGSESAVAGIYTGPEHT